MRYRVWAVNQRGYGRTTRPTQVGDYALPHLADDVTALSNAASAQSVVLIGHDWGAMVAWCFAAEQLHPLERLVIMNGPNPLCFRTALRHWRQMRKSWDVAFFQLPRRILTGRRDSATDVRWCGAAAGRVGGAKAGTAATLGFAKPAVSSPWAH